MTTRKEELKKEIEYLKERCLGVGVNVLKAELKGIQEGRAEERERILKILNNWYKRCYRLVSEPSSSLWDSLILKIKGAGK